MRRNQTILGGAGPAACAAGPAAPSLPRGRIVYTTKTVHDIGVGPDRLHYENRPRYRGRSGGHSVRGPSKGEIFTMISDKLVRALGVSRELLLVILLVPLSGCLRPWIGASDFGATLRCGMPQEQISRHSEMQGASFVAKMRTEFAMSRRVLRFSSWDSNPIRGWSATVSAGKSV